VLRLIGLVLALWLVATVVGAIVEALFWLAVLGAVLFVATAVIGWRRRDSCT
jgi:hypothetical protein